MGWFGMGDRRFRPRDGAVAKINCRVCYAAVDLHPDFIEKVDAGQHVMHCPSCRCTFPVRWDDSIDGRVAATSTPDSAPGLEPVDSPSS